MRFFQRGLPMVLVQNWPFFRLFFFGGMGQENVSYDILERRNVFLVYKNKMFKKSKNWPFFKGIKPWFWSKNGDFWILVFLQRRSRESVFWRIRKKRSVFRPTKHQLKKTTKINIFLKGLVHGLCQKMEIF